MSLINQMLRELPQQKEAVECYQRSLKTENLRKDLLACAQKLLRSLD